MELVKMDVNRIVLSAKLLIQVYANPANLDM